MNDIGFRISRVNKNALTLSTTDIAFNSTFPMDRIVAIAISVNKPHGLTYKPTLLAFKQAGWKDRTWYIDNYQINMNALNADVKGIALSQQGT